MSDENFFAPPKAMRNLKPASSNTRDKRINAKPGRLALNPQEFDLLIEDQGVWVRITPSILCPNRSDLTDTNHVLDCPLCAGDQVIDSKEDAVEEWSFIQGIKNESKELVQGSFDIKDATVTTKQKIKLSYWYKIEVLDFATVYNQVIKRSIGSDTSDYLRYAPAKPGATVLGAADQAESTKAPDIPYICIDSQGVRYQVDKHYKIDGRNLVWKGTHKPADGTLYSLIYPVIPTFRVLELIHDHRYYYVDFKRKEKIPVSLPQQAIIRWDYLARTSGNSVAASPPSP